MVFGRTAVLLLLFLASVPAASAATYYATPQPAPGATCAAGSPCELLTAIAKAGTGDDVLLAEGDYFKDGAAAPYPDRVVVKTGVVVHGTPGVKRPVLHGVVVGNAEPFVQVDGGGTLRDVALVATPASTGMNYAYGVSVTTSSLLERALVRVTGNGSTYITACAMVGGTIRDSACLGDGGGAGGSVVGLSATNGGSASYEVRNVTAISTAPGGEGIRFGTANGTSVMTASNVIARGTVNDVIVNAGLAAGTATLVIDHSNWVTESLGPGAGVRQIIKGAGNQTGATAATPLFADPAAGDYHVAAGSPTVDAGVDDDANGPLSLDGTARRLGVRTDMGAYEHDPAPPATGGGTTTAPPTTTTTSPPAATPPAPVLPLADRVAPAISSLSIGRRWRAGSRPATISAAKRKRPPVGTTIRLRLSEPATLTLAFSQRRRGRAVARGTLKLRAHTGTNTITFAGRLSARKRLKPGAHLLTVTATDAAGNRSRPRTARFTILAPTAR